MKRGSQRCGTTLHGHRSPHRCIPHTYTRQPRLRARPTPLLTPTHAAFPSPSHPRHSRTNLVQDDDVVRRQQRVGRQLAQQDALGAEHDARGGCEGTVAKGDRAMGWWGRARCSSQSLVRRAWRAGGVYGAGAARAAARAAAARAPHPPAGQFCSPRGAACRRGFRAVHGAWFGRGLLLWPAAVSRNRYPPATLLLKRTL
jgi:hypothetical protein